MRIKFCLFLLIVGLFSCHPTDSPVKEEGTIQQVMDSVITRLYERVPVEKYDSIDDRFMLEFLRDEEKHILATRYLYFTVNTPVTVSLMRHTEQKVIPFWLTGAGFVKTSQRVKNAEGYEYEVWEKKCSAGKIELGINGFDKHRPVYFISVAPQDSSRELKITDVYPSEFALSTLKHGAFTYHDW